jgi:hypothetical protein
MKALWAFSSFKMSALGHWRTFCIARDMSTLPPIADIDQWLTPVRFVPKADMSGGYENFPHARSVAHQMILLPARIRTPNASHP